MEQQIAVAGREIRFEMLSAELPDYGVEGLLGAIQVLIQKDPDTASSVEWVTPAGEIACRRRGTYALVPDADDRSMYGEFLLEATAPGCVPYRRKIQIVGYSPETLVDDVAAATVTALTVGVGAPDECICFLRVRGDGQWQPNVVVTMESATAPNASDDAVIYSKRQTKRTDADGLASFIRARGLPVRVRVPDAGVDVPFTVPHQPNYDMGVLVPSLQE